LLSNIGPKIKPKTIGAGEKPTFLKKNPIKPLINNIQISNVELLIA